MVIRTVQPGASLLLSAMLRLPPPLPRPQSLEALVCEAVLHVVSQRFSTVGCTRSILTPRPKDIPESHKRRILRINQSISIKPLPFTLLLPPNRRERQANPSLAEHLVLHLFPSPCLRSKHPYLEPSHAVFLIFRKEQPPPFNDPLPLEICPSVPETTDQLPLPVLVLAHSPAQHAPAADEEFEVVEPSFLAAGFRGRR